MRLNALIDHLMIVNLFLASQVSQIQAMHHLISTMKTRHRTGSQATLTYRPILRGHLLMVRDQVKASQMATTSQMMVQIQKMTQMQRT